MIDDNLLHNIAFPLNCSFESMSCHCPGDFGPYSNFTQSYTREFSYQCRWRNPRRL